MEKTFKTKVNSKKQNKQEDPFIKVVIDPTPEKAVSHYFQTKFENNLIIKKKPEWDVPRISPATELIMAKRDLLAAEKNLEIKREEQKLKTEQLDNEWKILHEKQMNLRNDFFQINEYVKKNYERREKSKKETLKNIELQDIRDKEIEELQTAVNYRKSVIDELEKQVKEHRIYEDFLKQVVLVSSEMQSPNSILNRYETLMSAKIELTSRQEKYLSALENTRTEMIKLLEEKSQTMMSLNTELAQLQIRYDKAKALSLRWETALSRIKNISAEKALELDQVKICCWNLYNAICTRKDIEVTLQPENIGEQLVFIKRSIQELRRILKIVQKKASKEISSTVQTPSEILI